jgi:hypothetical protein
LAAVIATAVVGGQSLPLLVAAIVSAGTKPAQNDAQ